MTQAILIPEIGVVGPKQILFKGSDYAPGTNNVIAFDTPTSVDLTLSGLTNTSARQSVKFDLSALRAETYVVKVMIEWFAAPNGDPVHFFWSSSEVVTAGVGNDGNTNGTDSAYTGYNTDILESVTHLFHIGSWAPTANVAVQGAEVGRFQPGSRFGSLVVWNESGATIAATDGIETGIVFNPIVRQGQDT